MESLETDKIADALTDIQHRLARAWVEGDREFIESVLADDWSVTDLAARFLTKDEVLREMFGSDERHVASMKIDDIGVRSFGDWAIVTGRTQAAGEYQGQMVEVKLRFTDVFVMRNGRWQAVSSQATMIQD